MSVTIDTPGNGLPCRSVTMPRNSAPERPETKRVTAGKNSRNSFIQISLFGHKYALPGIHSCLFAYLLIGPVFHWFAPASRGMYENFVLASPCFLRRHYPDQVRGMFSGGAFCATPNGTHLFLLRIKGIRFHLASCLIRYWRDHGPTTNTAIPLFALSERISRSAFRSSLMGDMKPVMLVRITVSGYAARLFDRLLPHKKAPPGGGAFQKTDTSLNKN